MFQTKEQVKTPETDLNETKIHDLLDGVQNNNHKDAHQGEQNNA